MAAARHHSPPPSQPNGASCVIWYRDPATGTIMVLVGVESRYVRDRHTSPKTKAEQERLAVLVTLEKFLPANKTEAELFKKDPAAFKTAAKRKFEERAKRITTDEIATIRGNSASADTSHIRFQFDTPILRKDGTFGYEARFRELKFDGSDQQQPKLGIIKGGREKCDETLADTVVREVAEEVGITLKKSRLTNMRVADGYACFSFEIQPGQVHEWDAVIAQRRERHYGELFHLGFIPLRTIIRSGAVNVMDAFERLPQGLVLPPGYELRINRKTISALRVFLDWINPSFPSQSQASSGKGAPGGKGGGLRKRRESRRTRRRHRGLRRSSRKR